MDSLQSLVDEWLQVDKDEETRQEILDLVQAGKAAELDLRLRHRIAFGTAGLRGRMEAGFSRMNSVTVQQASNGLAVYVLAQQHNAREKGIVIGRDARHNSEKFAKLAASTFRAHGIGVHWVGVSHTPIVPFAVQKYGAAAGVVITASHNPPRDNGYKVYWHNACQIIPPVDSGIASAIVGNLTPLGWDISNELHNDQQAQESKAKLEEMYCEAVCKVARFPDNSQLPSFVYTPMHGVGHHIMQRTIATLVESKNLRPPISKPNSPYYISVSTQAEPNPYFPTVTFPNPEEKGALDLAIKTADEQSINLIIATDPDADRLAVAERTLDGRWHQFTGNQLGVLLGSYIIESTPAGQRPKTTLLNSTVSTGMLKEMAERSEMAFEETLTGFKWLGNVAQRLMSERGDSHEAPYAFEEALGYMFTDVVFDKDGICAAAVFLAATSKWEIENSVTPYGRLQQLYETFGHFAEANTYLISPSPGVTSKVFQDIRASAAYSEIHPKSLGARRILRWRDLTLGYDSAMADGKPTLPVDESSQMISCWLDDNSKFTVRGSGTEPKIKFYIESRAQTYDEAQQKANDIQAELLERWFVLEKYGFSLP